MTSEKEDVYGTLTYNWEAGEGKVYVKGDLFMADQVTRIDLVQDWIVYLEEILATMRRANELENQQLREHTKIKGAKK